MTPTHPAAALWSELVKAVAAEVIRRQQEQPSSPSGLLAVSKAARQVGRTPRTVKNWIHARLLKGHLIRGNWYVDAREFAALLSKTDGRRRRSTLKVA
jgi:hypothetical protein